MRLTIVFGFFLPVPPLAGGATEKSWHELARRFAAAGHEVTILSRRWPGLAKDETRDGIRYLRLAGFDHQPVTRSNLLRDFLWSWRVFFALPAADIVVVHAVSLPVWLGVLRPRAGKVVVMTGRMPKGQYRWYRAVARILAPSPAVRDRVIAENPRTDPFIRVSGYPIDAVALTGTASRRTDEPITIGFVGRLHREKGLELLVAALARLATIPDLPPWRVLFCGPDDIARGGSGPEFRAWLETQLLAAMPASQVEFRPPQFSATALADTYRAIDVFCYPSLAEEGETFGVAVAEAMAAGAVPVVSALGCFSDLVRDGENGRVVDHRAPDATEQFAAVLAGLLRDRATRERFAAAAEERARACDFAVFAEQLLADFRQLTAPGGVSSSVT